MKLFVNIFLHFCCILLQGWAIYLTWDWFLMPVFPSLSNLSYSFAVGLSFVATSLKGFIISGDDVEEFSERRLEENNSSYFAKGIIQYFLYILTWLYFIGICWIFHQMIG